MNANVKFNRINNIEWAISSALEKALQPAFRVVEEDTYAEVCEDLRINGVLLVVTFDSVEEAIGAVINGR